MDGFVELYRSEQTWKSDMLVEGLKKRSIPYFMQHGVTSGLQLSPFTFANLVPGLQYIVYVPPHLERRARQVLLGMPFDLEEETIRERRGFSDSQKQVLKNFIRIYILILLGPMLLLSHGFLVYVLPILLILGMVYWHQETLKKRNI